MASPLGLTCFGIVHFWRLELRPLACPYFSCSRTRVSFDVCLIAVVVLLWKLTPWGVNGSLTFFSSASLLRAALLRIALVPSRRMVVASRASLYSFGILRAVLDGRKDVRFAPCVFFVTISYAEARKNAPRTMAAVATSYKVREPCAVFSAGVDPYSLCQLIPNFNTFSHVLSLVATDI